MKRSPKLKPTKWDALVVLAVLLLALGLGARPYFAAKSAGELTVSIAIDGETVERCALSNYEGGTYESRGYTLTVAVENGAVRVSESDCPNQDCVHSGRDLARGTEHRVPARPRGRHARGRGVRLRSDRGVSA